MFSKSEFLMLDFNKLKDSFVVIKLDKDASLSEIEHTQKEFNHVLKQLELLGKVPFLVVRGDCDLTLIEKNVEVIEKGLFQGEMMPDGWRESDW